MSSVPSEAGRYSRTSSLDNILLFESTPFDRQELMSYFVHTWLGAGTVLRTVLLSHACVEEAPTLGGDVCQQQIRVSHVTNRLSNLS